MCFVCKRKYCDAHSNVSVAKETDAGFLNFGWKDSINQPTVLCKIENKVGTWGGVWSQS